MSDATRPESVGAAAAGGPGPYVLDASALLCLINGEPGADRVAAVLPSAVISAVNLAEVASKLNELGADADTARALLARSIFPSCRSMRARLMQRERCGLPPACTGSPWVTVLALPVRQSWRDGLDHGRGLGSGG